MKWEAIIQSEKDLYCQQKEMKDTEAVDNVNYSGKVLRTPGNVSVL
jgi:hypothetical protein